MQIVDPHMCQVLILDSQPIYSQGIQDIIISAGISEHQNISIINDPCAYKQHIAQTNKGVIILGNLEWDELENIIPPRKKRYRDTQDLAILLIPPYHDPKHAKKLLENQCIDGIISRNTTVEEVVQCMHDLIVGKVYIGRDITLGQKSIESNNTITRNNPLALIKKLSIREKEIMDLVILGKSSSEIAKILYLSYDTIRVHRKNILKKMGASNTLELKDYLLSIHYIAAESIQ